MRACAISCKCLIQFYSVVSNLTRMPFFYIYIGGIILWIRDGIIIYPTSCHEGMLFALLFKFAPYFVLLLRNRSSSDSAAFLPAIIQKMCHFYVSFTVNYHTPGYICAVHGTISYIHYSLEFLHENLSRFLR